MATFDSWESYFYAETYNPITQDGTLRNLYGERDAATLHDLEYGAADRRSVELRLGIADVPRTYDAEHIRAIHGYLFQDVYEWAGQFRTVDMGKAWPPELGRGTARVSSLVPIPAPTGRCPVRWFRCSGRWPSTGQQA